jgi:hypothetical protein
MSPAGYLIHGRRYEAGSLELAQAITGAHASRSRPRCLCQADGVEMYVARLGDGYIVKRMPDSGSRHAPDCSSYEPPASFSGLGQVLGSAIFEDPSTGETTLKLDFALSRPGGRSTMPTPSEPDEAACSDGTRLSLRGLLHYLWDQAELTHWRPGFADRRSWGTVRKLLLQAAASKVVKGKPLADRLYVPEVFSTEARDEIAGRRQSFWRQASNASKGTQELLILIGEVKEIAPVRYGCRMLVKHVPDQGFALDESIFHLMALRFEQKLSLWGSSDDLHMVVIATFTVNGIGVPTIHELSLMPLTAQWLPVEDAFEAQLIGRLVREQRSFVKCLRYNLGHGTEQTSAMLLDAVGAPVPLGVRRDGAACMADARERGSAGSADSDNIWVWSTAWEPMPDLPDARAQGNAGSSQMQQHEKRLAGKS